ncbi:MAG: hypothetical protein RR770_01965 [Bacteroidales bacterium]
MESNPFNIYTRRLPISIPVIFAAKSYGSLSRYVVKSSCDASAIEANNIPLKIIAAKVYSLNIFMYLL